MEHVNGYKETVPGWHDLTYKDDKFHRYTVTKENIEPEVGHEKERHSKQGRGEISVRGSEIYLYAC